MSERGISERGIRRLGAGFNQLGARAHNERLMLSMIQRNEALPGKDLAEQTGLSAQTASNILRKLEGEGLIVRGEPLRGRMGKPSVPMMINPAGALSFGLKIGRRSADLVVMNLAGKVVAQTYTTFRYPMPEQILGFLEDGMARLSETLAPETRDRLCGIGIAAPHEIWSWTDAIGAPESFAAWQDFDLEAEVGRISALPVFTENDGTAACRAEHVFGLGKELPDYGYFFIGSFIGGGLVLNSSVVVGSQRNAGAFGSLRVPGPGGTEVPLIDAASLYLLEAALARDGHDAAALWQQPQDWGCFEPHLSDWVETAARAIAHAVRSIGSVLDLPTALIGGALPHALRRRIAERASVVLSELDTRGILPPGIVPAEVGADAPSLGAACGPIYAQYFLQ